MWPRTCVVTDAPLRRPNAGNETRKREWEKNRDALVMDRTGICNGVGINKIDIIICEMRCNTYSTSCCTCGGSGVVVVVVGRGGRILQAVLCCAVCAKA
jgi:hypothetical protein